MTHSRAQYLAAMVGDRAAQAALNVLRYGGRCQNEADRRSAGYWHGQAWKLAKRAAHYARLAERLEETR